MGETKKRFELTEDHLKLLRHAGVGWHNCETGAPKIDPKRPYGNSSVDVDALNNLWQRAQEAEREENCKAVCDQCANGTPLTEDGEHHYECEGRAVGCDESEGPHGYVLTCPASPIRRRRKR